MTKEQFFLEMENRTKELEKIQGKKWLIYLC